MLLFNKLNILSLSSLFFCTATIQETNAYSLPLRLKVGSTAHLSASDTEISSIVNNVSMDLENDEASAITAAHEAKDLMKGVKGGSASVVLAAEKSKTVDSDSRPNIQKTDVKTSFLQEPNTASDVKNGLFVSQPLRSSEQVRINVLERSPFTNPQTVASASQSAYLHAKFDADLARLRSSFLQSRSRFIDISTKNAAPPVESIDFAIESGIPNLLTSRRQGELAIGNAAATANMSRRRLAAESALDSMVGIERRHAAAMGEMLG